MKPPQSTNYHGCCLLLFIAALVFVGCRPAAQKPSPPANQTQPSDQTEAAVEQPKDLAIEPPTKRTAPPTPPTPVPSTDKTPTEGEAAKADTPTAPPSAPPAEPEATPPGAGKLGPPLGEDLAKLTPLQPNPVVWIDKDTRRVVMTGQVCQRNAPLEMFACPGGTKEHEAVVAIPTEPRVKPRLGMIIHAGLLAVGAKPGRPVQFHPKYVPANGTEIEILVRWKDKDSKIRTAKAQEWIRNMKTRKPMRHNWVFGGSHFWTDERTGEKYYSADGGDLICVSNFPSAMLDLPVESSQKQGELLFEAFTENIPPLGTPVTIILKPKLEKEKTKPK